ncbi:MAG: CocE/NonD family hydrolase [Lunatimonas sp.]|uniref:CocE/NonD family hydrolase n=1 Tax=Lunatimonas sp. TaxID=2060141 RepID=UPI00263B2A98|nr:CocE/NonD family hydrolase [Lunatimonas sp.]MCC5936889.1 CocE/NonD family hydrolase [Lunatimonas sp.]
MSAPHNLSIARLTLSYRYFRSCLLLLVLVGLGSFSEPLSVPEPDPVLNEIKILRQQAIPMRDGTILYADLYMPKNSGRYPVIVTRTPYGLQRDNVHHERMIKFAQRGYVGIVQDVRGRYESEGKWEPFRDEANDGYDTIEWIAKQDFSNGKIAMQGGSYLGHNQWAAASQSPPSLDAIFPSVASTNLYANWITMGGANRLSFNYGWGVVRMPNRIMLPQYWHTAAYTPEELRYDNILMHLPLKDGDLQSAGYAVQHYRDWLAHESYDDYWKSISDEERFEKVMVPAYNTGGWFDIFLMGTLNGYMGMKQRGGTPEARKGTKLLVGPWGHGPGTKFGDLDFGAHAFVDLYEEELRYYDYHLKGIQNGIDKEKPVRIFYMGENQWRHEDDWPIPRTSYRELYLTGVSPANTLRGGGKLSFEKPSRAGTDTYTYDPNHPVMTYGGNNCCGTPTVAGPKDQRDIERRNDVLVYTSDHLTEPLTVAGPIKMKLHAATDGPDTDWMIKLIDVYPDGSAYPVSEGILRAKFKDGLDKISLLTPNQVYEFDIEMMGTANVFRPGHRIRIDITSSNFPQFDRNPNTGKPLGTDAETRVAQQTIHHGGARPSHIVLPIVRGFE